MKDDPAVRDSLRRAGDSFKDGRVRAIFAIAPALGGAFTAHDLAEVLAPVKILVGADDAVAPPATNARRFAEGIAGATLTVLPGGIGHYDFLAECKPGEADKTPFCAEAPGVDRKRVHDEAAAMAVDFFTAELRPKGAPSP
jgi:predicted dienelactone hydrolase